MRVMTKAIAETARNDPVTSKTVPFCSKNAYREAKAKNALNTIVKTVNRWINTSLARSGDFAHDTTKYTMTAKTTSAITKGSDCRSRAIMGIFVLSAVSDSQTGTVNTVLTQSMIAGWNTPRIPITLYPTSSTTMDSD